jgi:hypothetical protein
MPDSKIYAEPRTYANRTIQTRNHEYCILRDGTFHGRESIEGAKIQYIAGISKEAVGLCVECLDPMFPDLRDDLDSLILQYGEKLKPGLHLVASLTPESAKEKGRHGIITTLVQDILQAQC